MRTFPIIIELAVIQIRYHPHMDAYFLYIIVYHCIIYVYRAMCMNVCMETLQYVDKLLLHININ